MTNIKKCISKSRVWKHSNCLLAEIVHENDFLLDEGGKGGIRCEENRKKRVQEALDSNTWS